MAKRSANRGLPGSAQGPGGTPATVALVAAAAEYVVHHYQAVDRSRGGRDRAGFGLEAAAALGVPPARVFKTLVADVDGILWVAVLPVSAQLDLKALAAAAGGKRAALAEAALAERTTGYVVGGISPLGQRRQLPTVLDDSALAQSTIFVSGGRRGMDLELAPGELVRLTGARTAAIARPS